jgi:hypothetical protein
MAIYAYHSSQTVSPINDTRAGTIRIGSDNPSPIVVSKGWDAVLHFSFRDDNQRPFILLGYQVVARIFNNENTQIWNGNILPDANSTSSGVLVLSKQLTTTLLPGLYSIILEYSKGNGQTFIMKTTRSLPRFIMEVIDQTTVTINN